MAETWRVVLRDGSVREASVEPATAYGYMAPESATHGWRATRVGEGDTVHAAPEAMGGDAADAVTRLAAHNGWPVREILAPGEPTRAEAVAAAQVAVAEAVRDAAMSVAAYSVPVRDEVLRPLPLGADAVELGRLVLLDTVPANAESFFVARCNDVLRREGLAGAVSFADPHPRTALDGAVVKPGHLGVIYTALSAVYLGPARPHTLLLLPDGRSFNRRALAKIRRRERGWRYAVEQLVAAGAGEPSADLDAWLELVLATVIRREPHPGCLKYALPFDARVRRRLPASKPYPKIQAHPCAPKALRCATEAA